MTRRLALAYLAGLGTPVVGLVLAAVLQHYVEAARREQIDPTPTDGRWSA